MSAMQFSNIDGPDEDDEIIETGDDPAVVQPGGEPDAAPAEIMQAPKP